MLSLGFDVGGAPEPRTRAMLELTSVDGALSLSLVEVISQDRSPVSLSALNFAGNDLLSNVTGGDSPELVIETNPGRVNSTWAAVAATASSGLVENQLYLLQYEILEAGDISLFFTDSLGDRASTNLNRNIGVHTYLLRGKPGAQTDVVRLNGDITFGFISLKRAEWSVVLPDRGPNLAGTPAPGALVAGDALVSGLIEPLEVGQDYEVTWTVTQREAGAELWAHVENDGPYTQTSFPSDVGTHSLTLTALSPNTENAMRKTAGGTITVSEFSIRKVLKGNDLVYVDVVVGSARVPAQVRTRSSGVLFCAPYGSNRTGTGAEVSPFRTVDAAMAVAKPGDSVYLRPGLYPPAEITKSGVPGNRIAVTTLPGEERQAIIDGTGHGGSGVSITDQEHLDILNLTVRNIPVGAGIRIRGGDGQKGDIRVEGCQIHAINRSAINCFGDDPVAYREGASEAIHLSNILLKGNHVYDCYRHGAGNEVISVGAGVSNIVIEDNYVHDSLQYGIDLKVGVQDAIVRRNRIWGVKNHGIYLDCAKKFLRRIAVYDNWIWGPGVDRVGNSGIVLAREAEGDASTAELSDIDIYNNRVFGMRRHGIMAFAHGANGGDQPFGSISNIRIRFNTVYDCGKDSDREELRVADWHSGGFAASGVVSNFEVIGNIFWRPGGALIHGKQAMIDNADFTFEDNVEIDPDFSAADVTPIVPTGFLPEITLPDFSLRPGSPAIGAVANAHAVLPFATDANGVVRSRADAGALNHMN